MKYLFSLIFMLTLSVPVLAQKKPKTKIRETPPNEYPPMMAQTSIDTLYIPVGKACVFVVDVNKYSQSSEENREEKELIKNFGKENLRIYNINKHVFILFANKQTLDVSGEGNSFQAFAYWGGQLEAKVQVKEGTTEATEFVSQQMGINKKSSYVTNAAKYKTEVALLQSKNSPTTEAKAVLEAYLQDLVIPIDNDIERRTLFKQKFAKVESIKVYVFGKKGKKALYKNINLNEKGQPTLIVVYDTENGKENGKTSFTYENDLLTKMVSGEKPISIYYNVGQLVISQNIGDADNTKVFSLANDILLQKQYILMKDDKYAYMNSFVENKTENNCDIRYFNEEVLTKNCESKANQYPFIHQYTSYQDGKILQYTKSKIEKKSEKVFEKYYSNAENESQKDDFKLSGTYLLNDNNLVTNFTRSPDARKGSFSIEYTYYP